MSQFESFRASELYCQKCGRSMPVREKLLLILPNNKEVYEYLCVGCGSSVGQREVSGEDSMATYRQELMDESTKAMIRRGFPRA